MQETAIKSTIKKQPKYPIDGGMGSGYLCTETNLFIGVNENNFIRRAYIGSEGLVNYLKTNF